MRPRALQLTDAQRLARRTCLHDLIALLPEPRQRTAAKLLGISEGTLCDWIKGRREVTTDDVLLLASRLCEVVPEREAAVMGLVARHLVGVEGQWEAQEPIQVGDLPTEILDLHEDTGELSRIARDPLSPPTLIETVAREVEREAQEVLAAARAEVERRRRKATA